MKKKKKKCRIYTFHDRNQGYGGEFLNSFEIYINREEFFFFFLFLLLLLKRFKEQMFCFVLFCFWFSFERIKEKKILFFLFLLKE